MTKLIFSKLTRDNLKAFVDIQEQGIAAYPWTQVETISLRLLR